MPRHCETLVKKFSVQLYKLNNSEYVCSYYRKGIGFTDYRIVGLKLYILCLAILYVHKEPYGYVHQLDGYSSLYERIRSTLSIHLTAHGYYYKQPIRIEK